MNQEEVNRFLRARLLIMIAGAVFDRFAAWADLDDEYCEPLLVPMRQLAGIEPDSEEAVWIAIDRLIDDGLIKESEEGRDTAVLDATSARSTESRYNSLTLGSSESLVLTPAGEQAAARMSEIVGSALEGVAQSRMKLGIVDWCWLFRKHDGIDAVREHHYYRFTEMVYHRVGRTPPEPENLNALLTELRPLYAGGYLRRDPNDLMVAAPTSEGNWLGHFELWDNTVWQAMELTPVGREAAPLAAEVFELALKTAAKAMAASP